MSKIINTGLKADFPLDCEACKIISCRIRSQWNPEPDLGGEFANAEAH